MINIESYRQGIVAELWEVYFTAIRTICVRDYSSDQVRAWAPENFSLSLFQEKLDKLNPFVAKIGSKIVGYADLQEDGLIDHFFVHGSYQSKGVGCALMNSIFNKGATISLLYSNVSNTARPFFERYGFVVKRAQYIEVRSCILKNNYMEFNKG